jgi:hypothetical protein
MTMCARHPVPDTCRTKAIEDTLNLGNKTANVHRVCGTEHKGLRRYMT